MLVNIYMNVQVPSNTTIDDREVNPRPEACGSVRNGSVVSSIQECPDNHTFVNNCQVRFLTKIYHPNIDKVR